MFCSASNLLLKEEDESQQPEAGGQLQIRERLPAAQKAE